MPDSEKKVSWWSTIPGTITAIATLITAIGGLLLALKSVGLFDKPPVIADSLKDKSHYVIDTPIKNESPSNIKPDTQVNADCTLPDEINGYAYLGIYKNHKYFISNDSVTWSIANSRSSALGGHLVTINSLTESNFITNTTSIQAWIGFTNIITGNKYQWITGEPVTYTNWADGEPNNGGGAEHYAILNWYNGNWNDMADSQILPFIIEFECSN